ncbi:MAG: GTP 3',8-cyclase MoaA [Deltaproteobacteria bacterium]|nr:GTP 3',8-cyclase MoaA [Deltaproteobacteria bacterium]
MISVDRFNRRIDYLRVAITDRCNLGCFYCMPSKGVVQYAHSEILTYEEILRIVRTAAEIGFNKVRLTGGEPLVRRDVHELVQQLANIPELDDLGMTTNGVYFDQSAERLFYAGLKRINISLDTLNPIKFYKITRSDKFKTVWQSISKAESFGFAPIKINVVMMRGVNDDEIGAFARLSLEKPYAIRFIEYMPIGCDNDWRPERFMSVSEIKSRVETILPLQPVPRTRGDGPAERYRFPSGRGEIGFIGAISRHFCGSCNRLRLTPDGTLRPCLMSGEEIDVKTPLREGCTAKDLEALFHRAIELKPRRPPVPMRNHMGSGRMMSRIGG